MNPDDFSDAAAGRLMKVGHSEAAFHAFVPAPLPPVLNLDTPLVLTLSAADRAIGELAGLGRTLSNIRLFVNPFVRQEAVLSSRIEGTRTDLAGLYEFEAGQRPGDADAQEVFNYVLALEYGLERLQSLPVSLRLMREVHARLMESVRGGQATPGEFRRSQNWIGAPGDTPVGARYVPPPVPEMLEALDQLERYLHVPADLPPLVRLALVHYQFEAIHPFLDGNGRMGRLLMTLLLASWGVLPHPLLNLSVYFEARRAQYYDHLMAVSTSGSWRDWLQFFLRGVAVQAQDAVLRARRLQDLRAGWLETLQARKASATSVRLMEALFDHPVLTIPAAQRLLGVGYPAAKANVDKLVHAGILKPTGDERYRKAFVAHDLMWIVSGVDGGVAELLFSP
ncbi:Adenosine monophosphate-protein transferase SoFic [Fundidesulfovibrio magnetotacticus]|uniref:Adenosine monophosphate-protein transferase SoFic n=1 Tax=Fundidesulfovibrio magnetotacticus TaxID=2730080 RepID=A0A6V8LTH4_9BACT|nr:Fic family protein [Fundidesulfovibrio magnetotacticus]GFK93881.1 Adenosine monophosphate-protein transferase SoFic [Fundidesulfovibrio magnetotacticus]